MGNLRKKGMALVLAGLLAWSPFQSFSAFAAVKTEEELGQLPGSEVVIESLFKDGADLNPEAAAYGSMERVAVEGQPFTEAIRFTTAKEPASTYLFQYVLPVERAMDKDDVLLATFYARTISSTHETAEGRATLMMEKKVVWSQSLKEEIAIPSEWKRFLIPIKAGLVMEENTAQVTFRLGYKPQVVEIADLKVVNYKKAVAFDELPSTPVVYEGMEEDAPWRAEANQRIEQFRKGDLDVEVKDQAGQPVAGADVQVSMTKHDFKFGTAVSSDMIFAATPEAEIYRTKLQENFNAVVMENDMKWPWWEKDKAMAVKVYNWLGERGFAVRGHNLIWEGAARLPEDVPGLVSNPAALNKRIEDHFHETAGVFRGRLIDWDVVNEPVLNSLIRTGTGNAGAMADWLQWAKEADPYAKLYINETQILGVDAPVIESFSQLLQDVKDRKAPLDGIGIQAHFGSTPVSPMAFYNQLTHFTQYAPEIAITEFDMNSPKEDIQGKFTRDILLAAFSHPNVESFTMWGFWDGKHWQSNAPLFRKDWSLKPSGEQWRQLVYGDWWTDVSGQSGGDGHFRTRGFYGEYDVTVTRDGVSQTVKTSLLKGQDNKVTIVWGEENPASGTTFVPLPIPPQTGDITPPVWPYGAAFSVPETTPTSVSLQWPAAKDNVAVDHYIVRMNGEVLTDALSGAVTRYDATRLEPGKDYSFTVEAADAQGNLSVASPVLAATTVAGKDDTLPGWTKGSYLTLNELEETAAALSWPLGVDNGGITGYRVYVNGQAVGDTPDTHYKLTGLTGNTLYTVRVEGQDSDGNLSLGGPVVIFRTLGAADTAPPVWPAASALNAADITAESLQLQWSSAVDTVGVEAYRLFKDDVELVTLPASANSYTVSGLSPHTAYHFRVEAGDSSGNWSAAGPALTVTTEVKGDAAAPVWPLARALTYRSLGDHSVSLDWTAAQDDTAVASYRLYRNGALLDTVSGDALTYTAAGLEPGASYTFRVEAGDASGNWTANGPSVTVKTFSGVVRKEQRIYPSDDAFIQAPATFGGDGTTLNLDYLRFKNAAGVSGSETNKNTGNNRRVYLKFPLQTVTGQVYKASLHLYVYDVQTPNLDISMDLYATGDNWSETAINWKNKPEDGPKLASTVVRNSKYWKEFAVDGYVASELAADAAKTVSFKLQDDEWKDQNVDMYSKESTVSGAVYRPYLLVGTEEIPVDEAPPEWTAAVLHADRVTPQSVTLSWPEAQDGQGVNGYVVYQDGVQIAQTGSDVFAYTITGLAPATAYTFRVEAKDAVQESATGPVLQLQLPPADTAAPVWPAAAQLTASDASRHGVSLAWTPAEDQYGVAAYEIYLQGKLLAAVPGTAATYRAEGLEPGTTHSFRIAARDEAGNAADGPSLQVATSPADTAPPQWTAGSALVISSLSVTGVRLNWPEAADDTGVAQYKLFTDESVTALLEPAVREYYVTGLVPGNSYRFAVAAVDAAGNASTPLELEQVAALALDTITPQWPTGSVLTAERSGNKVLLNWDAAVDNVGIRQYELYHNGVWIGTAAGDATSYLWEGLMDEGSVFKVEAVDLMGNATVFGPSTEPPVAWDTTPPAWLNGSQLTAEAVSETAITLAWSTAVDRMGVAQYRLYMNGSAIKELEGTTWRVDNLKLGTEYVFKVEAADEAGNWSVNGPSLTVRTRSASSGGGGGSPDNSGPTLTVENGAVRLLFPEKAAVEGKAAFTATDSKLADAFSKASAQNGGQKALSLVLPKSAGAKEYAVSIPASYLAGKNSAGSLALVTEWGTLELPGNMLGNHPAAQGAKEIAVSIALSPLSARSNVPGEQIAGLTLQATADGTSLVYDNKQAPVQVRIPYALTGGKQADLLNVWYIDANGKAKLVPSGRYEGGAGEMQFTASHFGTFVVSYWQRSFADLEKTPWARQAVETLASKGIINGVSDTEFAPDAAVTRADFAKLLVDALGLSASVEASFEDVRSGDYYYEAVGIAHKLGIVNGIESGVFAPKSFLTRQDMFLMMSRALAKAGKPVPGADPSSLSAYSDGDAVAEYAQAAVASMVKAGLIEGSDGAVKPLDRSTRAETAVMLHRLFRFVFAQ
ncbi:fibronectin type III domain-containing protein [Paenibacillus sp. YN15]|uniref:fibronectin type III domain-containing protein n=1 Tax=Paenibacillus sp. YN15 TaxID=1742774 RepID=UPI000DCECD84|nr:fibronectin type III domain-containing protein [Paenibacillus sp. YN15]RAV02016.1 hypothetical protein DQG13_10865 [Paenibacillus sp. YN15]